MSARPSADDQNSSLTDQTEDTDATNELINDGDFVQPLTLAEIQELKDNDVHASVHALLDEALETLKYLCRRS